MDEKVFVAPIEAPGITTKVITPQDEYSYFFGYYDIQPFSADGKYHLCNRAKFEERIPGPDDVLELGAIELETGKFIKYAETTTWNFQQGAMLRWYKDDSHIIFNTFENGAVCSCVLNIKTGERRFLPLPIADLTRDGTKAVSVNFSRIFNFRNGYGYPAIRDPYFYERAPKDDGVFLMDTQTGETKLLVSIADIKEKFPCKPFSDGKLVVNHINFNPAGTRYVMLFRNFLEDGMSWKSQLITGDLEGNLHLLADYSMESHYNWKNDNELLIFGSHTLENTTDWGLNLYTDLTDKMHRIDEPEWDMSVRELEKVKDIHCLYSPNRRYIMGDGYPDKEKCRNLHLIDTLEKKEIVLGRYHSYNYGKGLDEFRCDLHARFDRTGRYASFDSNHIGKRCICLLDLSGLEGYQYL